MEYSVIDKYLLLSAQGKRDPNWGQISREVCRLYPELEMSPAECFSRYNEILRRRQQPPPRATAHFQQRTPDDIRSRVGWLVKEGGTPPSSPPTPSSASPSRGPLPFFGYKRKTPSQVNSRLEYIMELARHEVGGHP